MERRKRQPAPPVATLGDLNEHTRWVWVSCISIGCNHSRAVRFAPLIERYGADASSDILRRRTVCSRCGNKGAVVTHPSWGNMNTGFETFPGGG